jgi:hypothetical protein
MQSQRDFRSLPIHGYNTQNPDWAGATVIAFQPLAAVRAGPSSSGMPEGLVALVRPALRP